MWIATFENTDLRIHLVHEGARCACSPVTTLVFKGPRSHQHGGFWSTTDITVESLSVDLRYAVVSKTGDRTLVTVYGSVQSPKLSALNIPFNNTGAVLSNGEQIWGDLKMIGNHDWHDSLNALIKSNVALDGEVSITLDLPCKTNVSWTPAFESKGVTYREVWVHYCEKLSVGVFFCVLPSGKTSFRKLPRREYSKDLLREAKRAILAKKDLILNMV